MTLLLTVLALAAFAFGAAELVRSTCRRQLMAPVRVRAAEAERTGD